MFCFFPIEVPGEPDPEIWKKQFSRVLSHDRFWENKTYKLKRSITGAFDCGFNISIQMWQAVDPYEPRYMFLSEFYYARFLLSVRGFWQAWVCCKMIVFPFDSGLWKSSELALG